MKSAFGIVKSLNGKTAQVEVFGQIYTMPIIGDGAMVGASIPVTFGLPDSNRLPVGIALGKKPRKYKFRTDPPFVWGLWPQSRGGPGVSMISQESQIEPEISGGSFFLFNLSPINPLFPPLSLCCPDIGGLRVAIYWPKLDGSLLQMTLTLANPNTGEEIFETPIGEPIAPPTGDESLNGLRMGWMGWDQQYGLFWLVGWGSSQRRKTIYCIDSSGNLLGSLTTGSHLVQGSIGAGAFIKGWHSRRPLTYRQAPDDPLIRGYHRNPVGEIVQRWTLDPQTLLPGIQLATSSAGNPFASTANPEGSWPIDAQNRHVIMWISGSRKSNNSNNTLLTYGSFVEPDDARTLEHKASLVAVSIDTGELKWRRNWNYTASHSIDSASVAAEESARGCVIGGNNGIAALPYYPIDLGPWRKAETYRGIAAENSLLLHPIENVTFPDCSTVTGSPVYTTTSHTIIPLIGPNWGGGGLHNSPSIYGAFPGPLYSYFAPGHPILCPLPVNVFDYDGPPEYGWPLDGALGPDDPSIARLDPVGGVLNIDSTGNVFAAHAHQSPSIVVAGVNTQAQWEGHTEEFVEAGDPENQCGQWINAVLHWGCWMIGQVKHNQVLRLHRTGPNGEAISDVDISQYFLLADSDKTWAARANVWQILVFVARGRVLVLRDKFDTDVDSGNLENRPYLAIEIRDRDDLGIVYQTIPLVEPYADTYTDESDPDNPVLRRIWDQYSNQDTATLGKGSIYQDGAWCLWRHLIYNRQEDAFYCNECLIEGLESGIVITRRLTSLGEFNRPESPSAIGSMAIAGGRQIWIPAVNLSGAWPVMVRGNA